MNKNVLSIAAATEQLSHKWNLQIGGILTALPWQSSIVFKELFFTDTISLPSSLQVLLNMNNTTGNEGPFFFPSWVPFSKCKKIVWLQKWRMTIKLRHI